MASTKPGVRPANPRFSSGPCAKPPTWNLNALSDAPLGRSHRAAVGKAKLQEAIDLTREVLRIPDDYHIGIVPASDTGAVEMAMWSLLGERPVQMVAWESFGAGWVTDCIKQLKIDASTHTADYGAIVDMAALDYDQDWSSLGTARPRASASRAVTPFRRTARASRSATRPLPPSRRACRGQARCDDLFLAKGHGTVKPRTGMLILGPRAVERLEKLHPRMAASPRSFA